MSRNLIVAQITLIIVAMFFGYVAASENKTTDWNNQTLIFGQSSLAQTGGSGYYLIESEPSGASVNFDGINQGVTPITVRVSTTGTPGHTIIVTKDGYYPWVRQVAGNPWPGDTINIYAALTKVVPQPSGKNGTFDIKSTPSGADVYIDFDSKGKTPVKVQVPSSKTEDYLILVLKKGYQIWSQKFAPPAVDKTTTVSANLVAESSTKGSIGVFTDPSGATVTLDGWKRITTPDFFTGVEPGWHVLNYAKKGYYTFSTYSNVVAGDTQIEYEYLTPISTSSQLTLTSNPVGSDVFIDQLYAGFTPLTVGGLSPGNHFVEFMKVGYQDWTDKVVLDPGQNTLDVKLDTVVDPTTGSIEVSSVPPGAAVFLDSVFKGQTWPDDTLDITNVQPGSHTLAVKLSGYVDTSQKVTVTKGKTSTIIVTLKPSSTPSKTGVLIIESQPQLADVYLNSIYQGSSPLILWDVAAGTNTITLQMSGYNDYTTSVDLKAQEVKVLTAKLQPTTNPTPTVTPVTPTPTQTSTGQMGYFLIDSIPSGAKVNLDGTDVGTGPVKVQVSSTGNPNHAIVLSLAGYDDWKNTYYGNPKVGETVTINGRLNPASGTIQVITNPAGAKVTLDGALVLTSPNTFTGVSPGWHTLLAQKDTYDQYSNAVHVGQAETVTTTIDLTIPKNGALSVSSTPTSADLYIDDSYAGTTPSYLNAINPGYHLIRLHLTGYVDYEGPAWVEQNSLTQVSQVLLERERPEPPTTGSLAVFTMPAGAELLIDDVSVGTTPILVNDLDLGLHKILVQKKGYVSGTYPVYINPGQITRVPAIIMQIAY